MSAPHEHVWDQTQHDTQTTEAQGERLITLTRYEACLCGERRPTKRGTPRAPFSRVRATLHDLKIARTPVSVAVAKFILNYDDVVVPWKGRRSALIKTFTDPELKEALNQLTLAGLVKTHERLVDGIWQIHQVEVPDEAALDDHVELGRRVQIETATREALSALPGTEAARKLREFLSHGAPRWEPETIRWAAATVHHGAAGKKSLFRQFSAQSALSKDFEAHRARIEAILDLEDLGLRDYPSQLLVGGKGRLRFPDDEIELTKRWGTVGIERDRLQQATSIEGNPIIFVENRTVFHAVASGTVEPLRGSLVVFSAGNIGPTATHLASVARGHLFGWMDLDPEGVQMIRRLHAASQQRLRPYRMVISELAHAEKELPGGRRAATLALELARGGLLQELLLEIQRTGKWLEQERQLSMAAPALD